MKFMTIFFIALLFLGVAGGIIFNVIKNKPIPIEENKLFLGPVPEGYDEQYFRETGITREEVIK